MIRIETSAKFEKIIDKLDKNIKLQINKQIDKILNNPEIGKPMMYARKGTRELHVGSFRLSYSFDVKENLIYLLDFYHKDQQ